VFDVNKSLEGSLTQTQNSSITLYLTAFDCDKRNDVARYNFGVQSPGIKWLQDIPVDERPPMLISHAITEGKVIDPAKVVGVGNHARAHPLYSGWNIMTMLSLRLSQGRQGVYVTHLIFWFVSLVELLCVCLLFNSDTRSSTWATFGWRQK
jgi:hypothetical protein